MQGSQQGRPTNHANTNTIRLNLAELRRLGDVEARERLSAEKETDRCLGTPERDRQFAKRLS